MIVRATLVKKIFNYSLQTRIIRLAANIEAIETRYYFNRRILFDPSLDYLNIVLY